VVTEDRVYPKWSSDPNTKSAGVANMKTGITSAKKAVNMLHDELAKSGFEQVFQLSYCRSFLVSFILFHGGRLFQPVSGVITGRVKFTKWHIMWVCDVF